jgi:hypothetical protein
MRFARDLLRNCRLSCGKCADRIPTGRFFLVRKEYRQLYVTQYWRLVSLWFGGASIFLLSYCLLRALWCPRLMAYTIPCSIRNRVASTYNYKFVWFWYSSAQCNVIHIRFHSLCQKKIVFLNRQKFWRNFNLSLSRAALIDRVKSKFGVRSERISRGIFIYII